MSGSDNCVRGTTVTSCLYNFCRVHQTVRVTPAMEAGLADHIWTIEDLVKLAEPKSILDGLRASA